MRRGLVAAVVFGGLLLYGLSWPLPGLVLWAKYGSDCGMVETAQALRSAASARTGLPELKRQVVEIGRDGELARMRTPLGEMWAPT